MQTHRQSTSADMTEHIAKGLGQKLRGGEIIELISDLGGGKTTFVRGLARGIGSKDTVSSPSFTLTNQYRAGGRTLYHFDFYRLEDAGIVARELAEVAANPHAIVVVEWADVVANVLSTPHLVITLKVAGEQERDIQIDYPSAYNYVIDPQT